jgi:1,4-dihydroxy-2-naphthoate octaprenyltransferase
MMPMSGGIMPMGLTGSNEDNVQIRNQKFEQCVVYLTFLLITALLIAILTILAINVYRFYDIEDRIRNGRYTILVPGKLPPDINYPRVPLGFPRG